MSVKVLEALSKGVLQSATDLWRMSNGEVVTTVWAMGPRRALFAQPVDDIGRTVTSEARVGFHALMGLVVKARYIGRVDETLAHVRVGPVGPRTRREMEAVADTDPSIHTAIVAEGLELATMTSLVHIARLELGKEGESIWVQTSHTETENLTDPSLRMCGVMVNDPGRSDEETRLLTFDDLDVLLRDLHWYLSESPAPRGIRR